MELDYTRVVTKAYATFKKPISEEKFWALIREYRDNFLLFVWEVDGVMWGQWQTNERYLARHKSAEDRRSPVPSQDAQDAFRNAHLARKKKSQRNQLLSDLRTIAQEGAELLELGRAGSGVGVGVGVGTGLNPEPFTPSEQVAAGDSKPDPIEAIYEAYPRKVGRGAAIRMIKKALKELRKKKSWPMREAEVFLYRRVQAYARSPAGQSSEFVPNPATWFNQGRYDDDPAEWQKKSSEKGTSHGSQGRNGFSGEQMSELLDSIGGSTTDHA